MDLVENNFKMEIIISLYMGTWCSLQSSAMLTQHRPLHEKKYAGRGDLETFRRWRIQWMPFAWLCALIGIAICKK